MVLSQFIRRLMVASLLLSATAHAEFDPDDMLSYHPFKGGPAVSSFRVGDDPRTVAERGSWAVVNYGRVEGCPAGGYYLVNTARKYYQFVDAGSCNESVEVRIAIADPLFTNTAVTHFLIFSVGPNDIARYPLYAY